MQKFHHEEGNLAETLGLGTDTYEVKLGNSFTNGRGPAFHTVKYDFKPASVDTSKMATVKVESNHQVTVTVPHLDGAGLPHTVFKGSERPYQKECVLIIDKATGQITLEKLSTNIQVKKTRPEHGPRQHHPNNHLSPSTEPQANNHSSRKVPSQQPDIARPKKSFKSTYAPLLSASVGGCIPKHSPLRLSPLYPSSQSPVRPQHKSPPNPAVAASLPTLGLTDDFQRDVPEYVQPREEEDVGVLSGTSSDSTSCASSDSEHEPDAKANSFHDRNGALPSVVRPEQILKEDLQLSESGSESD
ncbi:ell-associated factor Eaf [Bacillus rossius redtenbacheri]|uniref:ell-associated factor Eaf n=1 Tax=Bacillus rossius redtenbacheri TaxID=93214 RepID=UPI002FDE79D2